MSNPNTPLLITTIVLAAATAAALAFVSRVKLENDQLRDDAAQYLRRANTNEEALRSHARCLCYVINAVKEENAAHICGSPIGVSFRCECSETFGTTGITAICGK